MTGEGFDSFKLMGDDSEIDDIDAIVNVVCVCVVSIQVLGETSEVRR